ncbi:heme ABC transporter permease [Hyphobacterium sp. HN65]|uniref:Heme exporter protein C n=1 Tax=Hyphobacterium lacteum TaxID=3116575 RepID=A0ABU7LS64_9PROT|nr:heme ABC transporter permease [Hyphobacterium sp. HN65]MEE2526750.1 heme ABC transporter permease [Hyphobacterium sp. HN65]
MISYLANPKRFEAFARIAIPVCGGLALLLIAAGLWFGLLDSPPDRYQGDTIRIMYVHVPAAWLGLGLYLAMAVASFVYFIWRHNLADVAATALAPVGAVFAAICLVTGAIWGKPTWTVWWVWDARLTSMLIQFLLFLGYIALRAAIEDERLAARSAAILAMVGLVNLPIVRFSVEWWDGLLHQGATVFRADGPAIHGSQLLPLMIMVFGFTFLAGWMVLYRMRSAIMSRKAGNLQRIREAKA